MNNFPSHFYRDKEPQEDDRVITHEYVEADCALETEISHKVCDEVCEKWLNADFGTFVHNLIMDLDSTIYLEVIEELMFLRNTRDFL